MQTSRPNILVQVLVFVLAIWLASLVTGCASVATDQMGIVQKTLTSVFPQSFHGPVRFEHTNQYFTLRIEAGDLRFNPVTKLWEWDWLEYDRKSNYPFFSGMNWTSTGLLRFGNRPPAK